MENIADVNNKENTNKSLKKFKNSAKRIGKGALGLTELGVGFVGSMFVPVVGIPVTLDGILRFSSSISNTKSNHSIIAYNDSKMFSKIAGVGENDITQNIGNIGDILKPLSIKDKKTFLLTQELNFLLGADKYNEDGTKKVFNTRSQGITRLMLKRAEKEGLIENFVCNETDKGRLTIEKILMGNITPKTLFKKERKFNMSFSITDKQVTDEQILKFLNLKELDSKVFKIRKDKDGNILSVNYRQIEALKQRLIGVKDKLFKNDLLAESSDKKMLGEAKSKDISDKTTIKDVLKQEIVAIDKIAELDNSNLIKENEKTHEVKEDNVIE